MTRLGENTPRRRLAGVLGLACALLCAPAWAQDRGVAIAVVVQRREPPPAQPYSPEPDDAGLPGARLGLRDAEAAMRFVPEAERVRYSLAETVIEPGDDPVAPARAALATGARFVLLDLPAASLLAVADLPDARNATLINVGAPDTRLRDRDCRRNVLHTAPSHAMLADALLQFLVRKRWSRLQIIAGEAPEDALYAQALRDSARKFGAKVAADKVWTGETEQRRSVQADAALFTQAGDYDVVALADTQRQFGDALMFNTAAPRPVVGTHGLTPAAWTPAAEQWGAQQLQSRFQALAGRPMSPRDWAAWAAVRAIGEAALRLRSPEPAAIDAYMRSDRLRLDGFKGRSMSFRPWSGEMRQPIFLAHPHGVGSVSPQDGVLHPVTDLDTLGVDQGESRCRF